FDGSEGLAYLTERPASPPLEVGHGAGSEGPEPTAEEVSARHVNRDVDNRRSEPVLGRGPSVLGTDPRTAGPTAHDASLGGEEQEHPARDADHGLVLLSRAQEQPLLQLGDIVRELAGG